MTIATSSLSEYRQTLMDLLPDQGHWSDDGYLWLTDHTSRLIEYTDGQIEPLPMPTDMHQSIAEFFLVAFAAFLTPLGGKAHITALLLPIRRGHFRSPDAFLVH